MDRQAEEEREKAEREAIYFIDGVCRLIMAPPDHNILVSFIVQSGYPKGYPVKGT